MRAPSRPILAGLALAAFLGLGAIGCNALSGVESFVVEPSESEASTHTVPHDGAGADGTPVQSHGDGAAEATIPTASDAGLDAAGDVDLEARADAGLGMDATPDAADGSCLVIHSNGIGQSFEDCAPLGTRNLTEATAACVAYTGDAAQCVNNPPACTSGSVCSSGAALCACWRYVGPAGGHVSPPAATCGCASGSSPSWN